MAPLLKLLEVVLELFVPLVVAGIIDRGIEAKDRGYITAHSFILVLMALAGVAVAVAAQYFAASAATAMSAGLRADLYSRIMGFSYREQDALGKEKLLTRLTSDVLKVQNGVNMTLRLFLRSPFVVVGAVIMAFTVDTKSAVVFAVVVPILSVVVVGLIRLTLPFFSKIQGSLDHVLSLVRSDVEGARVIRAFAIEDDSLNEFETASRGLYKTQLTASRISAFQGPVAMMVINLATIYLIYVGAIRVDVGGLTQGQVVALVNYMSQILVELIKFANAVILLSQAIASGKRIKEVLDYGGTGLRGHLSSLNPGGTGLRGHLASLRGVCMSYPGASGEAVTDVDFEIREGEFVGIIGSTGCGKSTLVNIISGFYKPDKGIALEAKDFAIAPQKAVLFTGTIRDNLKWGDETADDDELWEAIEVAAATEVVNSAKGSLSAKVERGGSNFSGGQRQRLAVARAVVKRAPLLILDDSASALDYDTERRMRMAIRSLSYHPALLWVSQRISSIREADRIYVMEKGRIVGVGKHEELLETCGIYREIYESQI